MGPGRPKQLPSMSACHPRPRPQGQASSSLDPGCTVINTLGRPGWPPRAGSSGPRPCRPVRRLYSSGFFFFLIPRHSKPQQSAELVLGPPPFQPSSHDAASTRPEFPFSMQEPAGKGPMFVLGSHHVGTCSLRRHTTRRGPPVCTRGEGGALAVGYLVLDSHPGRGRSYQVGAVVCTLPAPC